jgi:L-serine dehydratase
MNIFDIVGPIMIGPSSSHTAGAVRIGKITQTLLNEEVSEVAIKLHGSFADTYKGHGTDNALIGGLMGFNTDDERIRDSKELARQTGMKYKFETVSLHDVHPNTVIIEAVGISGKKVCVMGSSIGGGNIIIKKINGLAVEFDGQYHALIVYHKDKPGVIGSVTSTVGQSNVNIAGMKVYRSNRGGDAIMIMETDQQVSESTILLIQKNTNVTNAIYIEKI